MKVNLPEVRVQVSYHVPGAHTPSIQTLISAPYLRAGALLIVQSTCLPSQAPEIK